MTNSQIEKHDSLILLANYLPTIYSLIAEAGKYRRSLIKLYERRYNQIKEELSLKGEFVSQSTIFDLLWEASEGIPKKKEFLAYIDHIVKTILKEIHESKRSQVRKTCYTMLASFTKTRSEYSRYLSELCVLKKLITNPNINLLQIEKNYQMAKASILNLKWKIKTITSKYSILILMFRKSIPKIHLKTF